MARGAYRIVGRYTIYTIVGLDDCDNRVCYVGHTRSENLNRILSRHKHGYVKLTRDDFADPENGMPSIYILEVIDNTTAGTSYRHVVSWHRHFDENGFVTLAYEGTEYAAYHMYSKTKEIYDRISKTNIDELLAVPYSPPPRKIAKSLPPAQMKTGAKLTQINIRLSESEREAFSQMCDERSFTQRDGFSYLLAKQIDTQARYLIDRQQAEITGLLTEIQGLQQRIAKGPRGANADRKLKSTIELCKSAIQLYVDLLPVPSENNIPVDCVSWKQFANMFPNRGNYHCPINSDVTVFSLEALCYSHGVHPAVLIWGIAVETGEHLRLRYYPKSSYMGIPLPHSPYAYLGAQLLVGYQIMPDGAADVYIALPLYYEPPFSNDSGALYVRKPSLDSRIQHARKESKP